MDLGVAHATASKATMLAAQLDISGVRRSLQTGMAFSIFVALFILALAASLGSILDWTKILKLNSLSQTQTKYVLLLLSAHMSIQLLGDQINAWFMAMNRASTGYFFQTNRRVFDFIITSATLILEGNAVQLSAFLLIGQIMLFTAYTNYAKNLSPWPILGIANSSKKELISILKPAAGHSGITFSNIITLQGGLHIINQIAPISIVLLYSLTRTLMRFIIQIGIVTNYALRPELSYLLGTGQKESAKKITKLITKKTLIVMSLLYVIMIYCGPSFIGWWSNKSVEANYSELALIGMHALINAAWFIPSSYAMANNQHTKLTFFYLSGSVFGILYWIANLYTSNPMTTAAIALTIPEFFAICFYLSTYSMFFSN